MYAAPLWQGVMTLTEGMSRQLDAVPLADAAHDAALCSELVGTPRPFRRQHIELERVGHVIDMFGVGHADKRLDAVTAGNERRRLQPRAQPTGLRRRDLDAAIVGVHQADERLRSI